jgi:diguanylate cyclase (GGDEF)-like protein
VISELEQSATTELSTLLLDMLASSTPPALPERFASIPSVQMLWKNLLAMRSFLMAASTGDLTQTIALRGFVGGTLKALQANLRHLTWQTKMIASGDFSQRVAFMGEFSQSFNAMVAKLDQTLKELVRKESELTSANEELTREVAVRKQTEEALRSSQDALRLLATTDPLTGLYNRRQFDDLAVVELAKSLRYTRPMSVMMIDIDYFKRVNDNFGHSIGDLVLKAIAAIIKDTLRDADILGRYGGEEFVAILPETCEQTACVAAERLRQKIEQTSIDAPAGSIRLTVSIGVSDCFRSVEADSIEHTLAESIARADNALYQSKNSGRNRVTLYHPTSPPAI